ncbi:hypothetical protein PIB30_072728, partial [Stylosanthes scabra]|nr:hypothetical protein [Stylosanthes scabra]
MKRLRYAVQYKLARRVRFDSLQLQNSLRIWEFRDSRCSLFCLLSLTLSHSHSLILVQQQQQQDLLIEISLLLCKLRKSRELVQEVKMQNKEAVLEDGQAAHATETHDWDNFVDDDIMQQKSAIHAEEAKKVPFLGDKEPISSLAAEYQSGSPILLEKIKVLDEQYAAIRRTRGDGNCFFRGFMFSYLEHILVSQDQAEVDRIQANIEKSRNALQSLGYADLTFEDFFA